MTYSTLKINVFNIFRNYKTVKTYIGEGVNVSAVVKCNCYGLGLKPIAPKLFEAGCEEFYVASLDEGITLRAILKTARIYVLNGIGVEEVKEFLKWDLIPVLNNLYQIKIWSETAKNYARKLQCILQIDSGMTRVGIDYYLVKDAFDSISSNEFLEVCYILSHLACSNYVKHEMNARQLGWVQSIQKQYPNFKYSLSNSGGIFLGKEYLFDQVRPGTILYGINTHTGATKLPISIFPVVNLTSRIIDIHFIKDASIQQSIGYGAAYKLKTGMVTATIPVGYGDGYPSNLGNKGYCYINNIKVPIIGQISMDLLCLDISNIPKQFQNIGQEVELIGDNISIEEVASLANTSKTEILTSLGHRYKIKYEFKDAVNDKYQS